MIICSTNPPDGLFVLSVLSLPVSSTSKLKLNRRSRWVNVPSSSQPPPLEKTGLSNSESSSSLVTNTGSVSSDHSSTNTISNGFSDITDNNDKKSISVSSDNDSSEKLTVTREEMVKGVVIKGIVCNPKNSHKSKSSASLNPFEKRLAPKPPAALQSESVPKTKSKTRGGSRNWNVLSMLLSIVITFYFYLNSHKTAHDIFIFSLSSLSFCSFLSKVSPSMKNSPPFLRIKKGVLKLDGRLSSLDKSKCIFEIFSKFSFLISSSLRRPLPNPPPRLPGRPNPPPKPGGQANNGYLWQEEDNDCDAAPCDLPEHGLRAVIVLFSTDTPIYDILVWNISGG